MSSNKAGDSKLPEGWVLCTSKSNPGRKYYFNKKTGKSSWTQPQDNDKSCHRSKHKTKRKCSHSMNKKQEVSKNLKRKCDSKYECPPQKRKHNDDARIDIKTMHTPKEQTPSKHHNTSLKSTPDSAKTHKHSPKNIANARMSHLREKLASEVKKEETTSSKTSPTKAVVVKKSPQMETQVKCPKVELKSPSINETKCSTQQSPNSDSMQSTPSPSQFFAANKIISSMKSQLSEEYSDITTNRNTFDVIEEGITNQTPEFPCTKHPATPPQFSEANKLVSAINSRLSYRGSETDTPVETFASAKDRMETLRTRLSNEANYVNTSFDSTNKTVKEESESMDVDFKQIIQEPQIVQCTKYNSSAAFSNENVVFVIDTNIFIHELAFIKNVVKSHLRGYSEQPILLVPWRVICELDKLKDNNNGNGTICKMARAAMDYLYTQLPESGRVRGQHLRDANSHIFPCEVPDDEILNCCLQQAERGYSVILLSKDKNLCTKASIHSIKHMSVGELKPLLEMRPRNPLELVSYVSVNNCENAMYMLLSNILENEMRTKYNNLWKHVVFKPPPWSFSDVLQCLLKHWIAVFNEVFPRIEHLIIDMNKSVDSIRSKDPNSLTQAEVTSFEELCMEVAKKCQIIPEYMELAKLTIEQLLRKCANETKVSNERAKEVIEAFEGLWTVFSSYCAKLSNELGVPHSLEDKIPGDEPLSVLVGQFHAFSEKIIEFIHAMQSTLSIEGNVFGEEQLMQLENAFKGSYALVGAESKVDREKLRAFCMDWRNLLQEACSKFCQLTEILAACRYKIPND